MTKDEALKLALEALDCIYSPLHVREIEKIGNAMKAIKEALAQPEQEPVAYKGKGIVSPASVLEMTRKAFGLNVSDLADVFQTTRQTVYQWMKLSDMEQVRSHAHLERIKVVYRATQFWNEQPILKGRWSKAILPTGVTMLDILKANEIDLDTLKAAHASLSGSLAQPEQEPVAWRTFDGEGNYDFREYEANESYRDEYIKRNGTKYASWVDPLYTTPPQRKPEQEPVEWDGKCVLGHCGSPAGCEDSDCCRADFTTPPQRKPLTDEQKQAMRLYKAVERLSLQAGEDTEESVDWLCGEHGGMFKLYEAYFSPKKPNGTCPTCESLSRAVMADHVFHDKLTKPLTDEQCINQMLNSGFERNSLGWSFTYGRLDYHLLKFARAIEAAHGIKE